MPPSLLTPHLHPQGPKDPERLAKNEPAGTEYDYESKIDFSVFPSLQVRGRVGGGYPLFHQGSKLGCNVPAAHMRASRRSVGTEHESKTFQCCNH